MQDPEEADMPEPRERLLETAWPEMPYGESGEAAPSLIPYQVMSRSSSVSARGGWRRLRLLIVLSNIRRDEHSCGHVSRVFVNSKLSHE